MMGRNHIGRAVLGIFVFLCAFAESYCQGSAIRFDHLTIKNGLSQSFITSIIQDKKGFIWIGTQDGLNRYDGYDFEVYYQDPSDSTSLSDSYIYDLYEDSLGFIWIATDNGISIFDPKLESFQVYMYEPFNEFSLSDNSTRCIYEDSKGIIWIGTASGGLNKFDRLTKKFTHYKTEKFNRHSLSNNNVRAILEDHVGNLWIGTEGGGLNQFDRKTERFRRYYHSPEDKKSLPDDFIWKIYEDDENRVWIGTNHGLGCLTDLYPNPEYLGFTNYTKVEGDPNTLSGNVVKDIFQDEDGIIWIATEGGGLSELFVVGDKLEEYFVVHHTHNSYISSSLSDNLIQCIFEDRMGSFWIGTNNGINKYDPKKQNFLHFHNLPNDPNSLNENTVWSLFEDDEGILWIGTRRGLNRFDRATNKFTRYEDISTSMTVLNNKSIFSIYQTKDGALLLGLADGLYQVHLNVSKDEVTSFECINYCDRFFNNNTSNRVYNIFEDKDSVLWIGTKNGLGSLDRKRNIKNFYTHNRYNRYTLPDNTIRCISQGKDGVMWVGTESGLAKLNCVSPDSIQFETYKYKYGDPSSLSNNMVVSMWRGKDNSFWLGTYGGGLNRFYPNTGKFERFTEKHGLSNNVIYSVLGDSYGNLWMSTNKGISKYVVQTKTFSVYEEKDGLQSNEFNIGAYGRNKDGEMFFGGINGFNIFDPNHITQNTHPPLVVLTDFKIFNKSAEIGKGKVLEKHISYTDHISLDYKQNNLTFEFSALHFSFSKNNGYSYKMVPFDADWNNSDKDRIAHYTNMDPGEYNFLVKGANSDGVWSEEIVRVDIVITPPFWLTWWFITGAILFVLAVIYAIYRSRIRLMQRQKDFLESQVNQRTKEIISQKEQIEIQKAQLEIEKEKSEQLLLNILPEQTVEELKSQGKAKARHYNTVSVMFTDFKSFTGISERMKPQDLVAELDNYFIRFDEIIEQYDIEKIKTIGDAYMCAGGVPIRNKSNPIDVVLAALQIQKFMLDKQLTTEAAGGNGWQLRLGIHTGEIIAGVIGIKRFAYDIWGDTVNVAARMETACEPGKVNISGTTYAQVKTFFSCTFRGKIKAKNKGEIDMYFVDRIKPEMSEDRFGTVPNKMFYEYVNLQLYSSINYKKAEKFILNMLKKGLSDDLYYHNIRHTVDVCDAVERIAQEEGIRGEDLFLLKTAALYHDAGFVEQYMKNEEIGVKMCQEVLPRFGYSEAQIATVSRLILATSVPQHPKDHLEEILCDADLDYLGRDDFDEISDALRREFLANNVVENDRHWDQLQISFLGNHQYFTATCRRARTIHKLQNLERVEARFNEDNYA